jgi:hypothetical protein
MDHFLADYLCKTFRTLALKYDCLPSKSQANIYNKKFHARAGYDISFSAYPSCFPPVTMFNRTNYAFDKHTLEQDFPVRLSQYQMQLSVDGNTATWSLCERMGMNSVLLKHESLSQYRGRSSLVLNFYLK